jgi:hypothetical protein
LAILGRMSWTVPQRSSRKSLKTMEDEVECPRTQEGICPLLY